MKMTLNDFGSTRNPADFSGPYLVYRHTQIVIGFSGQVII